MAKRDIRDIINDGDLDTHIKDSVARTKVDGVGLGQTIQDMTSYRALATDYTNDTGKTIFVTVNGINDGQADLKLTVNGLQWAMCATNSANKANLNAIPIPPGTSYRVEITSGTFNIDYWTEMRS